MRNGEGRDQFPSNEFNPLVTKSVELPHNMFMLKNSSNENISNHSTVCVEAQDPGYLLQQRLELVEDLWKTVLKSECPPNQTERLLRLKQLSDPGKSNQENSSQAIVQLITEMDLAEAISAARAFSLYFQLVNILEQRIEEDSYLESIEKGKKDNSNNNIDPFAPALATQTAPVTFTQLFERLRRLNVPPAQLDALMREMDIRLVFTAHPTEIVRHTVRHKQRRVATLLQHLQSNSLISEAEKEIFRLQLEEEIRLWWRTDELHQFKPTVLDAVSYTHLTLPTMS